MTEEVKLIKRFESFVLGFCKCGCNQEIPLYDSRRRKLRLYVNHHYMKGRKGKRNPMFGRNGHKSNCWRGGKFPDKNGYIMIYKPDHRFTNPKGYVREHRLIYEEYHKCCLFPWIIIHHINDVKNDNRIENLQLVTKTEHNRIHINIDPKTGRFYKKLKFR